MCSIFPSHWLWILLLLRCSSTWFVGVFLHTNNSSRSSFNTVFVWGAFQVPFLLWARNRSPNHWFHSELGWVGHTLSTNAAPVVHFSVVKLQFSHWLSVPLQWVRFCPVTATKLVLTLLNVDWTVLQMVFWRLDQSQFFTQPQSRLQDSGDLWFTVFRCQKAVFFADNTARLTFQVDLFFEKIIKMEPKRLFACSHSKAQITQSSW